MSGMGGLGGALRAQAITVGGGVVAAVASGVYYAVSPAHSIGGLVPFATFLVVSAAAMGIAELVASLLLWNALGLESGAVHLLGATAVYVGLFLASRRLFLVDQQRHQGKVLLLAAAALVAIAVAWLVQTPAFHNWWEGRGWH